MFLCFHVNFEHVLPTEAGFKNQSCNVLHDVTGYMYVVCLDDAREMQGKVL